MRRKLFVLFFITILSVPAFADAGLRVGVSADVAGSFGFDGLLGSAIGDIDLKTGFTLHAAYTPLSIVNDAIKAGLGFSWWIPRGGKDSDADDGKIGDWSLYASGFFYPLRLVGKDDGLGNLYARLNLGYNKPKGDGLDALGDSLKGGLYWGIGAGFEFAKFLFVEVMYGKYAWSLEADTGLGKMSFDAHLKALHLTIGAKF